MKTADHVLTEPFESSLHKYSPPSIMSMSRVFTTVLGEQSPEHDPIPELWSQKQDPYAAILDK